MNEEHDKLFQKLVNYLEDANEKHTNVLKAAVTELKEEIRTEVTSIKKFVADESKKREECEKRQKGFEARLTQLEKLSRKNNIVIFGLIHGGKNLLNYTIDQINQLLNININSLHINNIFPIGKPLDNSPILVQFTTFHTKLDILRQCKKLKGTGIHIAEDLTKEERENRKVLVKHQKQARSRNQNAYIRHNKLIINEEIYTAEDLKNLEPDCEEETNTEIQGQSTTHSAPATPSSSEQGTNINEGNGDEGGSAKVVKKRKFMKTVPYSIGQTSKPTTRNTATRNKENKVDSPKATSIITIK